MATARSDRSDDVVPARGRNPRGPSALYGGATAVLLVVILLIAMNAPQVAPPAVAEISPQAVEQIKQAPDEQASNVGSDISKGGDEAGGDGENASGDPNAPSNKPPRLDETGKTRADVHKCVGSPPRQIEDPQAPPCVPFWEGDNGGKTWKKGVTEDEVVVAVGDPAGRGAYPQSLLDDFAAFFNDRFEFYGRKLRFVSFATAPEGAALESIQFDAAKVDEEIGAFAAASYGYVEGRESLYFDELARRQIVSVMQVSFGMPAVDEAHMRRNAPYQWNYTPSADVLLRTYGSFICTTLAKKGPAYAGGAELFKLRKFGVILDTTMKSQVAPVNLGPLRDVLKSCDEDLEVMEWAGGDPSTLLIAMRNAGVTSLMFTGPTSTLSTSMMVAASAQHYEPEWLVWNFGHQDDDDAASYFTPDQAQHVIGLSVYNKTMPDEDLPSSWALREADPEENGSPPDPQASRCYGYLCHWLYESLLVIASGIQMAGPRLTPQTFEQGLFRARFPNPDAGAAPYYQATVGFPRVHTMVQDVAPIWLSSSETSVAFGRAPSYCYPDQGKRYRQGTFPADIPFRATPCR